VSVDDDEEVAGCVRILEGRRCAKLNATEWQGCATSESTMSRCSARHLGKQSKIRYNTVMYPELTARFTAEHHLAEHFRHQIGADISP